MGLLDFAQQPGGGLLSAAPQTGMGGLLADPSTALFASLLGRGNFGANLQRGIAGAQAQAIAQQEAQQKGLLYGAQIENYRGDAALNAAKVKKMVGDQEIIRGILPGFGAAGSAPQGGGGMPPSMGSMPTSGDQSQAAPTSPADILQRPDVIAKLSGSQVAALKNAGLDVTEIWKTLRPKIAVAGGYAYDENNTPAGFLPQVNTSASGQTSLIRPDGRGGVTVAAPPGAIPTFQGYQQASQDVADKSAFRPSYGPNGQPGERSIADIKNPPQPVVAPTVGSALSNLPQGNPGAIGSFQGAAGDILRQIADIRDPQERSNALQAYANQQQQSQGFNATGPSAAQEAEQAALKTAATGQATADVQGTQAKAAGVDSANNAIATIDLALNHPGLSTATGLSGVINPANYIPGTDAKDFQSVLGQLKGTAFLTAYQGLRGTGAISEIEGQKAENAVARLNSAQSTPAFTKALSDYKEILQQGLNRQQTGKPATAGSPAAETKAARPQNLLAALPAANANNRGKEAIDHDTGKRYVSDGMQWKEKK